MVRNESGVIRPSRAALIWNRWRTVLAGGVATFTIEYCAAHVEAGRLDTVAFVSPWIFVVFGLGVLAFLLQFSRRNLLAALGVRHPLAHPPLWIGVALGSAVLLGCLGDGFLREGLNINAPYNFLVAAACVGALPIVAVLVGLVAGCRRGPKQETPEWADTPNQPTGDELAKWCRTDEPVSSVRDDRFGHRSIARRMAIRLAVPGAPAQALLGALGTGKTTVRELVREYLKALHPQPSVELICIELWPYETPKAAVEGILAAVTEALSREISTSQLDGVAAEYGELITRLTGVSGWIPRLVDKKPEFPFSLLEELDGIAVAIDRRYVLWVEDLERFAAGRADAPSEQSELEKLAPIRALLFGLDRLHAITVVTATTDLYRRFDLEKIARYVERVPELSIPIVRRLLSRIRQDWLAADDLITFTDDSSRRERLGWDGPLTLADPEGLKLHKWFGNSVVMFAAAVASLATTPRALKHGLRRADETWQTLRGEIDPDHLLAMSMMRAASPGAFALVEQHVASLRAGWRDGQKDPWVRFGGELDLLQIEQRTKDAVKVIVNRIFKEDQNNPQGFVADNHADYWSRFQTVPELPEGTRDQDILRELRGVDDAPIVNRLNDVKRAAAVEDFASFIADDRLVRLLSATIERELKSDPTTWEDGHVVAVVRISRIALTRRRPQLQLPLRAAIERGIDLAVPSNLSLAYDLVYWFTSTTDTPSLFDEKTCTAINRRVVETLLANYLGKGPALALSLKGSPLLTFQRLCYGQVEGTKARQKPFPDWDRFVPTMLDAIEASPEVMAPRIAVFLTRSTRRLRGPDVLVFDREMCELLFGDVAAFLESFREKTKICASDPFVSAVREQQQDPQEDNAASTVQIIDSIDSAAKVTIVPVADDTSDAADAQDAAKADE